MEEIDKELKLLIQSGHNLIYLLSFEEDRAKRVIDRLAATFKTKTLSWSQSRGFGQDLDGIAKSPADALAEIAKVQDPAWFILNDFHAFLDQPYVIRTLREVCPLLARRRQYIFFVAPVYKIPVELEKDLVMVELLLPDPQDLGQILDSVIASLEKSWNKSLKVSPEVHEKMIRAGLGLTEKEARRVFLRAFVEHPEFKEEHLDSVLSQKKQIIRQQNLLEFYKVSDQLDEVGGLDLLKDWLKSRSKAFSEEARKYGLPAPRGLLMLGIQGCGKSLCAKAVSNLWRLPLLRFDSSIVLGSFQAPAEVNIRRATQLAESISPCVLWIDEIEKGFSAHLISGKEASGEVSRAFASFLVWLQERKKAVYVIATANSISELPPELVRKGRFDDIFFVDLPKIHEREEIFLIHLKKRGRKPEDFDLKLLASESDGFSGSEIEQSIISAMYEGFTENREITTEDIRKALSDTVPLSETMEEQVEEIRRWVKHRARPASMDTKLIDLLSEGSNKENEDG
jgi:SpoVK/Ycf46/Vps4 family AAA+-type ATPase